jgi:hypothetical protein
VSNRKNKPLYLYEGPAKSLANPGREKGLRGELVRESAQDKYMSKNDIDKAQLARQLSGVWRNRKDLKGIDHYVRRLRRGTRLKRLGLG